MSNHLVKDALGTTLLRRRQMIVSPEAIWPF